MRGEEREGKRRGEWEGGRERKWEKGKERRRDGVKKGGKETHTHTQHMHAVH